MIIRLFKPRKLQYLLRATFVSHDRCEQTNVLLSSWISNKVINTSKEVSRCQSGYAQGALRIPIRIGSITQKKMSRGTGRVNQANFHLPPRVEGATHRNLWEGAAHLGNVDGDLTISLLP
jgi:hypothetical protein